jgi:hypothetical protein
MSKAEIKPTGKTESKAVDKAETKPVGKAETRQAGKGSKRRPYKAKQFAANYEAIRWGKRPCKKPKAKPAESAHDQNDDQ